jgi:hypothetical protein
MRATLDGRNPLDELTMVDDHPAPTPVVQAKREPVGV